MALVLPPFWMPVSLVSGNDSPAMLTTLQESIQGSMPLPGVKPPANTGFPVSDCEDPPDYPPFRVVPRRTKGFEGMDGVQDTLFQVETASRPERCHCGHHGSRLSRARACQHPTGAKNVKEADAREYAFLAFFGKTHRSRVLQRDSETLSAPCRQCDVARGSEDLALTMQDRQFSGPIGALVSIPRQSRGL